MITIPGATGFMKTYKSGNRSSIQLRLILLLAMLTVSGQCLAWIAFGFKSGMSRFDVARHLSENESFVITDGEQQTYAGPADNQTKYNLIYCSRPQRLYLMQFSLDDSLEAFEKTKRKFEKRYGEPTPLNSSPDYRDPEVWENAEISFIWDLNESETILLSHTREGSRADFQDLSVCEQGLTGSLF